MSAAIYHITTRTAWEQAHLAGSYTADSLVSEGFIHCSMLSQVLRVANTWFRGMKDLVLLELDPPRLQAEVRWEPGTDKAEELFPHLYGALNLEAVQCVFDLHPDASGVFHLPADLI